MSESELKAEGPGEPPDLSVVDGEEDHPLSGLSALVVDDNFVNLEIAVDTLEFEAMSVDQAIGGAEAIDLINQNDYDLICLDLNMPEIGGLEVGQAVRASQRNALAKVLIFSACSDDEISRVSTKIGADGVVKKPVDIDEFVEQVRSVLS